MTFLKHHNGPYIWQKHCYAWLWLKIRISTMTSSNFPETCLVYSLPFPACWVADNRAKQSLPYLLALRIVSTNHRKMKLQAPRKDRYRKPGDKHGTETWKQVYCYVILSVQYVNECRCTCSCQWKSPTRQNNLLEVPTFRLSSAAEVRLTWRTTVFCKVITAVVHIYRNPRRHVLEDNNILTQILWSCNDVIILGWFFEFCVFISECCKKNCAKFEHWTFPALRRKDREARTQLYQVKINYS